MKGIVIDINNRDAVILSDDGLFKKIKNRNYEIGQTLQIDESGKTGLKQFILKPVISSKLMTGAARIAAVLTIGIIGAFAWYTPTDYISLDVNPSVEYTVNMFERILDVHAVNEDGEEILSGLKLKNKNIETGLRETLDELIAEGYLVNDPDSGVVIAASSDKQVKAEQMAETLKQEVQTYLEAREDVTAEVDAGAASPAKVKEAKDMGVTPGKLHLVEKLQASTTGAINMQQWVTKPVKDINKEIKKNWETSGWDPYAPAQQTYSPYWNWNQNQDQDRVWSGNQNWNQDWNQYWEQYRTQQGASANGAESNENRKSGGSNNGSGGSKDTGTYQTWNWNQSQSQGWNQDKNKDEEEDKDKNQTQNWNQYWLQTETREQSKTTSPAINPYQGWDWKQYWVQPGSSGSRDGNSSKSKSSNKDNNNGNTDNTGSGNSGQDQSQGQSQDKSQNQTQDQSQGQSQDKNQSQSQDQSHWNWYQNQDRNRNKSTTPGQIQTSDPAQTVYKNWNMNQNTNKSQEQNKNKDKSQDQNKSQDQSQNKTQSWSQNRNQNWDQDWSGSWNWAQPVSQTTPGAAVNGGYGNWNGSWGKSGSQDDDDDRDRSGGKSRKSRNND